MSVTNLSADELAIALDTVEAENGRLRGLLREAQTYGIPAELYLRIDAALAGATDQPDPARLAVLRELQQESEALGLYDTDQPPAAFDFSPAKEAARLRDADSAPVGREECEHGHYPAYCPQCGVAATVDSGR